MFLKIRVKNFKSLVDFEFDLSEKKNTPKNLALIYGENGSGKTNIVSIFYTLIETFRTMDIKQFFEEILEEKKIDSSISPELLRNLRSRFKDLEAIIKESRTVGVEENLLFEFEFKLNDKVGIYVMEFNNEVIISEKLDFLISEKRGTHFELTQEKMYFNPSIFKNVEYLEEIKSKRDKFWGKHTLLAILMFEKKEKNSHYFKENINRNLLRVLNFFDQLTCKIKIGDRGEKGRYVTNIPLAGEFLNGEIAVSNIEDLDLAEEILNRVFTELYADIKNVYYVREEKENQQIGYALYAKKMIGSKIRSMLFELESTGTLSILNLLPPLLMAVQGAVIILDEFDSGIHDILIKKLLEAVNSSLEGQLIMTTHNTLLLESDVENKNLYFLTIDSEGNKDLLSLDKYDLRTRKNHNRRTQYLKGMYDAVPFIDELDLVSLIKRLDEQGDNNI